MLLPCLLCFAIDINYYQNRSLTHLRSGVRGVDVSCGEGTSPILLLKVVGHREVVHVYSRVTCTSYTPYTALSEHSNHTHIQSVTN